MGTNPCIPVTRTRRQDECADPDPLTIEHVDVGRGMWLRRQSQSARGDAPDGNMMTTRIEIDGMEITAWAQQQDENDRTPVTTMWKWNTPEEASALLEGVDWMNDGAL